MHGDSDSGTSAEYSNSDSNRPALEPYKDEERLRELYHGKGLSQQQIAERFDVRQQTIKYWMDKLGVDARPPMNERDPSISFTRREDGKVQFKVPDGDGGRVRFYRHQAVALLAEDEDGGWEYELSDVFRDGTHVHHEAISPVALDIPCNLAVLDDRQHLRFHAGGSGESHVEEVLAELFDDYDGEPAQDAVAVADRLNGWKSKSAKIRNWQSRFSRDESAGTAD